MSALRASVWAPAIGILAVILLVVATLDIEASAHGMGRGVGSGGSRGASFGRGGSALSRGWNRSTVHSFSAPHGNHTSMGSKWSGGNRISRTTASAGALSHATSFSHAANVTHAHQLFGNRVITNAAFHHAHVPFHFHGRFFGSPWPWWWGGVVIGWVGPVFWPYFYYDFFDYVFWPYAYDDFWPYAYDDIYYGIYGPYAYSGPPAPVGSVDSSVASSPRQLAQPNEGVARQRTQAKQAKQVKESEPRAAEVCSNNASELAQWPIERISQVVQPTDAQRAALNE